MQAEEAIARVYYGHQRGTTRSFEEAIPPEVLRGRVDRYLRINAVVERVWNLRISQLALERELERMVRDTRFPGRLRQIFDALGGDPDLVLECFVRPVLVERLGSRLFRDDDRIHADQRLQAFALRLAVLDGRLDPAIEHPARHLERIHEGPASRSFPEDAGVLERFVDGEELERLRQSPVGAPGEVKEASDRFYFLVVLEDDGDSLLVAVFSVPKVSWAEWLERQDELRRLPDPLQQEAGFDLPYADLAERAAACPEDDTWTHSALDALPDQRVDHLAVWTGNLLLVWGGTGGAILNSGGRYDPLIDSWRPITRVDAPSPRGMASAVWTGSEMIVWGGNDENTGGRYDPINDTWQPTSTVGAPEGRNQHTAVWTGSEMIVWGGGIYSGGFQAGGRYEPVSDTWAPVSVAGAPEPRRKHTAVWDGDEMIVWGGEGWDGGYFNTGGRYDPATNTWLPTTTEDAPDPRTGHTAVWSGSEMIVWGGAATLWGATGGRYDPASDSWTATSLSEAPEARWDHEAVWTGSQMIVWGGNGLSGKLNSGGRYDAMSDTWSPTSPVNAPSPRIGFTAVWTGDRMIVWGGNSPAGSENTGGRYDPQADLWTPTGPGEIPGARTGHVAVWTGNEMLVSGGQGGGSVVGERYDPLTDSWSAMSAQGAPAPRTRFSAIWTGSEMIVWGGATTGGRYDPGTDLWLPMTSIGAPSFSSDLSAVWTGEKMIVWGGSTQAVAGGIYDPTTDTWMPTTTTGAPAARVWHAAVWSPQGMLVWGGYGPNGTILDGGGLYDPDTDSWKPIAATGAPSPRIFPEAVWTGTEMLVWGGFPDGFSPPLADGARYDPVSESWTPVSALDAPTPREGFSLLWTGSRAVLWGGWSQDMGPLDSGGRYDPVADTWVPTSTLEAPWGREEHTAVWTGEEMLVWGGKIGYSAARSGGGYVVADQDGDGFTVCAGDCDDLDPNRHPASPDVCDGIDNDCDQAIDGPDSDGDLVHDACDCAPSNSGSIAFPVEVSGLTVDDGMLSWENQAGSAGSGTVYDVLGGMLSVLRSVEGFAGVQCGGIGVPASAVTDPTPTPPDGDGFYFLARARNACGAATFGDSTLLPDVRDALDAATSCP